MICWTQHVTCKVHSLRSYTHQKTTYLLNGYTADTFKTPLAPNNCSYTHSYTSWTSHILIFLYPTHYLHSNIFYVQYVSSTEVLEYHKYQCRYHCYWHNVKIYFGMRFVRSFTKHILMILCSSDNQLCR